MNIGNGFFSYTENEALQEMKNLVGCDVRHCVFPTIGNIQYYISEHGDLFGVQKIQGRFLTRGPKKAGSLQGHGKRKDGGVTHRINVAPHKERWIAVERLVFCTFLLGHWENDLEIEFKNGKATDIRPDNLQPKEEKWLEEWTERMYQFQDIYKREFSNVAQRVKWWCFLPYEDAKDVTQSTYIWLTTIGFKDKFNVGIWVYWAKKRGQDLWAHVLRHFADNDFEEWVYEGTEDNPYEVDLVHVQPGEKRARYLMMWLQNHTPTEIAEECNSTIGNVAGSITRSIQFLRKYLKHEKDLLR